MSTIYTSFYVFMRKNMPSWGSGPLVASPHLWHKNQQHRDISSLDWLIFMEIDTVVQNGSSICSKMQRHGRPPFRNTVNQHISVNVWSIFMTFVMLWHYRLLTQPIKITNFTITAGVHHPYWRKSPSKGEFIKYRNIEIGSKPTYQVPRITV